MNFKFWQSFHNFHSLETDRDDLEEEIERITLAAHISCVIVEIIHDVGNFVDADASAFHHPIERRFLVDDILLRFKRYVLHGNPIVVDQRGLVLCCITGLPLDLAPFHLRHAVGRLSDLRELDLDAGV